MLRNLVFCHALFQPPSSSAIRSTALSPKVLNRLLPEFSGEIPANQIVLGIVD